MKVEDYPLVVLEDLEKTLQKIRTSCKENPFIIKETESVDGELINIISPKFKSFNFEINSVELKNQGTILYKYHMNPWTDTVNKKHTSTTTTEQLLERFDLWKTLIGRYDKLNFDDPIIGEYENEIFEYLKILDEDADKEPFNVEQQVALLKYLDKIGNQDSLENEQQYVELILQNIEETKIELTRLPKNQVMRKISIILAYSRKSSLKLFKSFFEMFKKEIMKKALWAGMEKLEELISIIKNLPM